MGMIGRDRKEIGKRLAILILCYIAAIWIEKLEAIGTFSIRHVQADARFIQWDQKSISTSSIQDSFFYLTLSLWPVCQSGQVAYHADLLPTDISWKKLNRYDVRKILIGLSGKWACIKMGSKGVRPVKEQIMVFTTAGQKTVLNSPIL